MRRHVASQDAVSRLHGAAGQSEVTRYEVRGSERPIAAMCLTQTVHGTIVQTFMPLSLGTRLGAYEVLAPIGAGGMGEVYLARDTRLDRDVAIKVLPAAVAQDGERLLRFEREAKILASLNHPNIAQVYGVEESGETRALVMELVAGSTLAVPQPIATALDYGRQIAEALEAAHEKGITHRDLKPANIMIRPDGVVKILDFGLATVPVREAGSDPANSPTSTMTATQAGMIMGTASYMSPEQAAGKAVDKRSDIWSFGVVLWEMLTGAKLFEGETLSHTLADVLRAPIDLGKLPESTPPPVRRLIARCLERDVKQRLRDIGEARILLNQPFAPAPETPAAAPSRSWLAWGAAAVLFAIASALAFAHFRETPAEAPLIRTYIPPPDRGFFNFTGGLSATGPVALSSDGHRMTFSAKSVEGRSQLWVRAMDALTAHPLAGTEEAIHPFWSPDSRFIGFFAGGKLKKIDTFGGPPVTLCDAPSGRGGSWNEAGVIVFAPNGIAAGLQRVSASGGVPAKLDLDVAGRWPWFLPGGRNFLYSAGSTVRLGSLDSSKTSL